MLKDLPTNILNEIAKRLKLEVFLPNDIIIKAGTFGDAMYFILYGTVAVFTLTGKEVNVRTNLLLISYLINQSSAGNVLSHINEDVQTSVSFLINIKNM